MVKNNMTPVRKKPGLYPLCVRFKSADLEAIRVAAARQGEVPTVWIRGVVMLRVVAIEEGMDVPKLRFERSETALNAPISIRFRPAEHRRAARAATQDGCPFSHWARATVLEYISRAPRQERAKAVGE